MGLARQRAEFQSLVTGWYPSVTLEFTNEYFDDTVAPGASRRYRIDWKDLDGVWKRMSPDRVGKRLPSENIPLEEALTEHVAEIMDGPYAVQLWSESAIQNAIVAAGMVPNFNESGDGTRVPIVDFVSSDGDVIRYQRGENLSTSDAAIFYCVNENWAEVHRIDITPAEDD